MKNTHPQQNGALVRSTQKPPARFPNAPVSWRIWSTPTEPLRGSYFHRIENGVLTWQGAIIAQFDGYVLIEVFEWITGFPSCRHLVPISDLVWRDGTEPKFENGYLLYDQQKDLVYAFQDGVARQYRAEFRNKEAAQ